MLLGMIPGALFMPTQAVALPAADQALFNYPSQFDGWQPGDAIDYELSDLEMSEPPSIIHSFYDIALTEGTSRQWNGFSTPDHVVFDEDSIRFLGYGVDSFMDMVFYEDYAGGFDSISFTLTPTVMNFHTFSEAGLLFNGEFSGQYYTGYALILKNGNTRGMINDGEAQLSLIYIENELMDGESYNPGTLASTRTLIGTYKTGIQTLSTQPFDIQIDKRTGGAFTLLVDGIAVQEVSNPRSNFDGFGFFTGYYRHHCTILTVMEFSQVAVTRRGGIPPQEVNATVRFVDYHSVTDFSDPLDGTDIADPQTIPYPVSEMADPQNPVSPSYVGDLFRIIPPPIIDGFAYKQASRQILDPIRYRSIASNPNINTIVLYYTADIQALKSSVVGDVEGTGTADEPIPVSVGSQFDYTVDLVNPGGERLASGDLLYGETIIQVVASSFHSLALTDAGNLYAWGHNWSGQLGNNTTTDRRTPVKVSDGAIGADETIIQVAASSFHNLALTDAGNLYAWGTNGSGQLGDNTITQRNAPVKVLAGAIPATEQVTQIAAGSNHNLVLTDAGNLYTWGDNWSGQLGDNTTTNRRTPVKVSDGAIGTGEQVIQIAVGEEYNLVLTDAGNLYTWGYNWFGQLGDNTTTNRRTPVKVSDGAIGTGEQVTQIAAGPAYNLVLTDVGNLYAWGHNIRGQLGDDTTTNRSIPVRVLAGAIPATEQVTQIAASSHSLALTDAGNLYAWGSNGSGQLGDGTTTNRFTPVKVLAGAISATEEITQVAANSHSLALTDAGNLYAWGWNFVGQLGDNTTTDRLVPIKVLGLNASDPFTVTDLIPQGLSLVFGGSDPAYVITNETGNAVDIGFYKVTTDTAGSRDQITFAFGALPAGITRFTFKVSVDAVSDPVFVNQATFYDSTESDNPETGGYTDTDETYHATGVSVTEKYQAWGSGVMLADDTLRGFGPAFDDAIGDGYSPYPFRLRPIMDAAGDMWRLVGYQRIGVDSSPVLGHPPMGMQYDADEGIWVGDGWCFDSITQDEEIVFFFAKDVRITIDFKDNADRAGANIKSQVRATVPGMVNYNMPISHMDAFGTWNYANAYSLDGGVTVQTGNPPMPTYSASQMATDQHIVLYFTQSPVVTVQYREYGADTIRRQNSQLLFDANGVNREIFTLTGSSPYMFDPMAQSSVSDTVNNGATSFNNHEYPVYRGWSDDGGATISTGAPPEFSGITEAKHIILYFTTQYVVIEKFQANDAAHGVAGTTLKADVLTQVWGGDPFTGDAPRPILNALGADGVSYEWHYIGWVMDKEAPDFDGVDPADFASLVDGVTPPTIAEINASDTTIIYIYWKGGPSQPLTVTERFREYQNTGNILSADASFLVDFGSVYTGNPKDLSAQEWHYVGYQIDGRSVVKGHQLPLGVLIDAVEQAHTITYLYSKVPSPPPPPPGGNEEFLKLPQNQTAKVGDLVSFGISGFGNTHNGPAQKYRITDYPPKGLDLVSMAIPAFTKGEGLFYSILYNTNKQSSIVYASGISASREYSFKAPILQTGEYYTAIAIYFDEVPSGFGVGDQITYTFRVAMDASGQTLVNKAVFDYRFDGDEYEEESKAVAKVVESRNPRTGDSAGIWQSVALLMLGVSSVLFAIKRKRNFILR